MEELRARHAKKPGLIGRLDQAGLASQPSGRNDPCPCGSGRTYKKCCGRSSIIGGRKVRAVSITHLCRLRFFGDEERWGFAFYTYSNERYQLAAFPSGEFFGTPEEAFDVSAGVYLSGRG